MWLATLLSQAPGDATLSGPLLSASSCAASSADELWDQVDTPRCVRMGRSIMAESQHGRALPND
jgi:hypothetical protein